MAVDSITSAVILAAGMADRKAAPREPPSTQQPLRVTLIIRAIYESARTGRAVELQPLRRRENLLCGRRSIVRVWQALSRKMPNLRAGSNKSTELRRREGIGAFQLPWGSARWIWRALD